MHREFISSNRSDESRLPYVKSTVFWLGDMSVWFQLVKFDIVMNDYVLVRHFDAFLAELTFLPSNMPGNDKIINIRLVARSTVHPKLQNS